MNIQPHFPSLLRLKNSLFFLLICVGASAQQASFTDISVSAGINNTGNNYGVAVGDYNNDGWEDIYVSIFGASNKLYRNNGDNTFTDVAGSLGVADESPSLTSAWGDINNDGWVDLYVGNRNQPNSIYLNNGNGTFSDITPTSGLANTDEPRSIMMADVNNDGLLDIYVANLFDENALFINNGDLTFSNETQTSGATDTQINMGAIFFDYDNDRDQDLYLTHDADQTFILYENDGSGHFTDVTQASGTGLQEQGMGVDVADFNHDGNLDIYVTNLHPNSLLKNMGDGTFTDISASAGIGDPGMSWGTVWLDYDNDSYQDIYMANDYYFGGSSLPNILYRNNEDETFSDVSLGTPLVSPYGGYGTACADFNNDGLIDIFVANRGNDGNQLFINTSSSQNDWLKVKLIGTQSNKDGVGTRIEVLQQNGTNLIDELNAGSGYSSQNSSILHFGLGPESSPQHIRILWPSGQIDEYLNPVPNQLMTFTEGDGFITSVSDVDVELLNDIEIIPNPVGPATDLRVRIQVQSKVRASIRLVDILGRTIQYSQSLHNLEVGENEVAIDHMIIPDQGLIFLIVELEGVIKTRKVLIR